MSTIAIENIAAQMFSILANSYMCSRLPPPSALKPKLLIDILHTEIAFVFLYIVIFALGLFHTCAHSMTHSPTCFKMYNSSQNMQCLYLDLFLLNNFRTFLCCILMLIEECNTKYYNITIILISLLHFLAQKSSS